MINKLTMVLVASVLSHAVTASAQQTDVLVDRILRTDAIHMPTRLRALGEAQPLKYRFRSGIAYSNDYGPGSSLEVPLNFTYAFSASDSVSITSGLLQVDDGSDRSRGMQDITLSYNHRYTSDGRFSGAVGGAVIVPAGGDVGSTTATQLFHGGVDYGISDRWAVGGGIALVHVDELPVGVDNTGQVYSAAVSRSADDSDLTLSVRRKLRDGTTGTTSGELEYGFTLDDRRAGSVVIGHVFTRGRSSNSVELNLSFKW